MLGEQPSDVVGGAREGAAAVEVNHVHFPVALVDVLEQRRVARHLHEVAVLLDAHHVDRVVQRRHPVAAADAGVGRELADVQLPRRARVGGEAVEVLDRPVHRLVGMLVDDVDRSGDVDGSLIDAGDPRAQRDLDLRVFRLDRRVELRDTLAVARAALLVADLDVLQRERPRVAVLRPLRAPLRRGRADRVFDGVERVLDQHRQIGIRQERAAPERARHAGVHDPQRVGADVFRELQELVVPEAVRAPVAPRAVGAAARFDRPDRSLPLRPALDGDALGEAAAGTADEAGLEIRDHLREVRTQAVRSILERLRREERDHVEPHAARLRKRQCQPRLCIRRARDDRRVVTLPAAGCERQGLASEVASIGRLQSGSDAPRLIRSREEAQAVLSRPWRCPCPSSRR